MAGTDCLKVRRQGRTDRPALRDGKKTELQVARDRVSPLKKRLGL